MGNAILRRSRRACALCNALGEHAYPDEPYDTFEGSCIYEGWIDYRCTRCNNLETIWTGYNTSNHEGPVEESHEDSTCVTSGYDRTICTACDEVISEETLDLDPNNHEGPEVDGEVTLSTCVTHGNREVICDACGVKIRDEELPYDPNNHEGPILDNTQDMGKVPTCISEGYVNHWCVACNETWDETLEIDPNNHEGPVNTESSPSTCVTQGYYSWYCEACGEGDTEELPLDPSNHEGPIGYSGDGQSSTCVTPGDREAHCDACGEFWAEELPLDPNNHEAWVDGGLGIEGHCEACGAVCEHEFYTDSEGYFHCSKCGYYDY